jgi:serine/threonine-protein kinase
MKRIAPRPPTPAGIAESGRTTGRLPDDLVREQIQRLALFAAVGAGLWTVGMVMDTVLVPLTVNVRAPRTAIAIEVTAIIVSIGMYLCARYGTQEPRATTAVGLAYMLFNAFAIAMLNTWVTPPTVATLGHISWIAIVILVSSMIVPASPPQILIASLAAASMDPLGVWIAHLRGFDVPSLATTLVLCMPSYSCAIVATLPSRMLQHIGRRLRQAQELGSYHLIELLGHGGMGEVWRARHQLLARHAAIKLVRPELLGAATQEDSRLLLRRFEREARATAALGSPHSIQLFDYGRTDEGTFYYVMEFLQGRDLESLIREFGPLPADRAMFLLRQVCHSLADAHARGLVHRDIKPANIYVCRMGLEFDFVKVLDFGLVKFSRSESIQQSMMTMTHGTTGTPAYMAPEIILGESDVDMRADVYAVGCVAYFLLTGQLVFEADTSMKMLMQHVHAQPVPPSQRSEMKIPRELDELIMSCLQKDPNLRPQNAEALLNAAHKCRTCETWDQDLAKLWWQRNLPELTGPLALPEAEQDAEPMVILQ